MLELKRIVSFKEEDFDADEHIKASSLMYCFQEIASEHADILELGFEQLIKENLIWVMNKLKFRIYGKLKPETGYEVSTYPRQKRAATWFRDYYVHDVSGKLLAAGTSQWCMINFETRKIERTDMDFEGEYTERRAFEEGIERIRIPELEEAGEHVVLEEDIDVNRHTNNCKYADMIGEVLKRNDYESFTINFSHETMLGDRIIFYKGEADGNTIVVGRTAEGRQVFQASVKLR